MRIKKDLKNYLRNNLEGMAESHLDAWKDRYFGYTKKRLAWDLELNHDDSLEIENAEETLKRKLSDNETGYLIRQFHKEVISQYIKD